MMQQRLESLLQALADAGEVLILPHTDPDPDAIASALALAHLLAEKLDIQTRLAYTGIIGRAENRALVQYLGSPLRYPGTSDLRESVPIALVDTQPGTGNNALPEGRTATIVIDHHAQREATAAAAFADVRPELGATSTMLTQYLRAAGIEPEPQLATALFYGIKTDTMGLGRGATQEDVDSYFYLQPLIDVEGLVEIEHAQVPAVYFTSLVEALQAARVYDGAIVSYAGSMSYPDMAAEIADLLLRVQGIRWVICTGHYRGSLFLSVRTRSPAGGAARLVQEMVRGLGTAGGHGTMAGGRVSLEGEDPEQVALHLTQRAMQHLHVEQAGAGTPLV
jgi:nanoRNase/pAp phosphatase (c-di-AMP/oligoRNAs hydrolase)